jgi:predicted RND superfamily exporter protein
MNALFKFLIRHKYLVIIAVLLACGASLLGIPLVETSFELSTFMPKDASSIAGNAIEDREFSSAEQAYVLLENKENWEVIALKQRIEDVEGVAQVLWLDDVLDIYTPEDFLSENAFSQFKKGDSTILIIEFADENEESGNIDKIAALMEDGEYFGGQPVVLNELGQLLSREQSLYLLIAGAILIGILAISLSSYIAPLLCILNIGIAIVLNYGTNFMVKDQVSFLTIAIGAVLQLAVSMDFSIFLIHRFEEDLKLANGDVNAAMASSMRTTLTAISSSALTDCAGFMALVFMQNQIGADIGIVLCKGVVFSLIASMTFLPCAILATYPLGKRKHRVLMPSLEKLSNPLIKYRFVLLAVVIAALVPGIIGSQNQQYYYTSDKFMPEDTKPIIATEKIGDTFGTTDTVNVLYDKTLASQETAAAEEIEALKSVRDVSAYSDSAAATVPDAFIPDALKDTYIGDTYRRFTVTMERGMDNDMLFAAIDDIRDIAKSHFGEDSYVTGAYASAADMASTADTDNMMVELISIAFIFVILLMAFRSLLIPVFLVLVIKTAIYINVGFDFYFGEDMIFLTPVLVNSIQLGATVDYAILFTSRYVEFRRSSADAKQAIRQTIAAATRPMLTSVLTFYFATLSITMISSIKATREISSVVGRGALISFVVIMFALPALFILFDKPLRATTLSLRKKKNRG